MMSPVKVGICTIVALLMIVGLPSASKAFTIMALEIPGFVVPSSGKIHDTITINGLDKVSVDSLEWSSTAVGHVTAGNRVVDYEAISGLDESPANHFDGESFGPALVRISTLKEFVKVLLRRAVEEPEIGAESARRQLGAVLHTIQDFYSHTNWVERGSAQIVDFYNTPENLTTEGSISGPGEAACEGGSNPLNSKLTSGYYKPVTLAQAIADGKCHHAEGLPSCDAIGLNKDIPCRGEGRHQTAVMLATMETTRFVESLIDELRQEDFRTVCLLLGEAITKCPVGNQYEWFLFQRSLTIDDLPGLVSQPPCEVFLVRGQYICNFGYAAYLPGYGDVDGRCAITRSKFIRVNETLLESKISIANPYLDRVSEDFDIDIEMSTQLCNGATRTESYETKSIYSVKFGLQEN